MLISQCHRTVKTLDRRAQASIRKTADNIQTAKIDMFKVVKICVCTFAVEDIEVAAVRILRYSHSKKKH